MSTNTTVQEGNRGRGWVIGVIVAALSMSVGSIALFIFARGTENLFQQAVRLVLTIGLCVFLYRGANWARLLTAVLCVLGGLLGLLLCIGLAARDAPWHPLLAMAMVYLCCAAVLLRVPSVRSYFRGQSKNAA